MQSLVLLLLVATPDFQLVEETDGIRIEARPRPDSKFVELRFTTTSRASVEALCDAAYGDGKIPADEHTIRQRRVLRESTDERVTYDVVSPPVISERDYVLKWTRAKSAQRCVVRFGVIDSKDAPQPGRLVRLSTVNGEWTFVQVGDHTSVQYVSHAEPGGDLPPFIVEGPRRSTELDVVRRTVARARR